MRGGDVNESENRHIVLVYFCVTEDVQLKCQISADIWLRNVETHENSPIKNTTIQR